MMTKATIPDYIFLQVFGDQDPADIEPHDELSEISWNVNKIFNGDVRYVRADNALNEIRRLRGVLKSLSEAMRIIERDAEGKEDMVNAERWATLAGSIERQIYEQGQTK